MSTPTLIAGEGGNLRAPKSCNALLSVEMHRFAQNSMSTISGFIRVLSSNTLAQVAGQVGEPGWSVAGQLDEPGWSVAGQLAETGWSVAGQFDAPGWSVAGQLGEPG